MPSREEYLKWAKETFVLSAYDGGYERIEALCNRVWNEAIEAVLQAEFAGYVDCDDARSLKQGEQK